MVTLLGVLIDTLVVYDPTKFEADRPNGLEVITNHNSLRDQVLLQVLSFKI